MALTIQDAKDAIKALVDEQLATGNQVITEEALRNIVNDVDIDAGIRMAESWTTRRHHSF